MLIVVDFPAPFGPEESEDLTGADLEVDAADRLDLPVGLDEVTNADHRPAHARDSLPTHARDHASGGDEVGGSFRGDDLEQPQAGRAAAQIAPGEVLEPLALGRVDLPTLGNRPCLALHLGLVDLDALG